MTTATMTETPFGEVRSLGRSRVKSADGTELAVEEWGDPEGQPILFVHAWSQSRFGWLPQAAAPELQGHRMVAFDHRGHGDSEKPAHIAAYANDQVWAADIAAVIEARGLKDVIIVGWSPGGLAVLDYLKLHGQSGVAGVVLVGHVNGAGVPAAQQQFGASVAHAGDAMSADLDKRIAGTLALVRALVNKDMPIEEFGFIFATNMAVPNVAKAGMLTRTIDHADTLRELKKPLLIVNGSTDTVATLKAAERAKVLAPHAELHVYDGIAHAPAWEERERFNQHLANFAQTLQLRTKAA
jgi:non-heme chloroperoxidase